MYTPDRDCFFAYEGLCVALHKLAFPTRGSSGVALFGRSAPALSRIRRYFMTYFVGRFASLIQFDPLKYTARLAAWAAAIHGKLNAGYHNIIGFIDCKLVGVAQPLILILDKFIKIYDYFNKDICTTPTQHVSIKLCCCFFSCNFDRS